VKRRRARRIFCASGGAAGTVAAMSRAARTTAVALLLAATATSADDPAKRGFDPDPWRPALGVERGLGLEMPVATPRGSYRLSAVLDYAEGLLALSSGDEQIGDLIESRLSLHLAAAYSFGALEVGLGLPIALHQEDNMSLLAERGIGEPLTAPVASSAVGDLRLLGKWAILREPRAPLGLAAALELRAPTGDGDAFYGDGPMAIPSVAGGKAIGPVRVDGAVGYAFRGEGQFAQLVVHDGLTYGVGVSGALPRLGPVRDWRAIGELHGGWPRGNDLQTDRYSAPLAVRAGVRAVFGRALLGGRRTLAVDVGGGTGLGEAGYGRERWRVFAGLSLQAIAPDRDGDGVPDDRDRCPDQPGLARLAGCPEAVAHGPDRDGDGLADTIDRCPEAKGPPELQGCPDTDGDEIPDDEDKCPKEKGPARLDGCPLPPGEPVVEIETERLSLKDAINFDTGRDTLKQESHRVLDELANVLRSHPELQLVRVEGHTDNVGGASYNRDLSQRRAAAVVRYLVGRGIARERLAAAGYGFDRPVAPNTTNLGRAKNRRVEFTILEHAGNDGAKR
jgi:OmpA-OmpF porin, OOP family